MKKTVTIFLMITAAFLLQTAVFPYLPLGGACPNLLLILVVSFALIRGSRTGIWMGFFSGMLMDLFFGPYLGLYALLYIYIGAVCGVFQKRFYPDDIKFPLFLTGISDLLFNLIYYIFLFYIRGKSNFGFYLKTAILPECVFTMIITILVYVLILRVNNWLDSARA